MLRALVLAAGESRRMGRPKCGLRIRPDGPTFAATIATTVQLAGLDEVTVVAGAHPDAVRASLAGVSGVRVVEHPGWALGQLSSLVAGLDAVDGPGVEGVLVALVDSPLVRAATVATLIGEWRATRAPVVRPAWGDRHGHPVIFDRAVFPALRTAPLDRGAKVVLQALGERVRNVPSDDPGIFVDVDTPEIFAALGGAVDS